MVWVRGYRRKAATETVTFLKSTANLSVGGITYLRGATEIKPGQCMHLDSNLKYFTTFAAGNELRGIPCVLADYEPASIDDTHTGEEITAQAVFGGEIYSGELTGFDKTFKDGNTNILYF